jgi:ribosomal protein S18
MSKLVEKKLYTIEVLNILGWLSQENNPVLSAKLPIKLSWDFRKNIKVFEGIQEQYNQFDKELQERYIDDKYSYDFETEDENGDKQTIRRVKDEYLAEYSKNKEELLFTENNVSLFIFNIEDFGDDIELDYKDMELLSVFITDSENEDKENVIDKEEIIEA